MRVFYFLLIKYRFYYTNLNFKFFSFFYLAPWVSRNFFLSSSLAS